MVNREQAYEALFNNGAIGIITVNQKGEIISINKFALNQFGYTEEHELVGKTIEVLIPKRFKQSHSQHRNNYQSASAHSRPMGSGMDLYGIKKDDTEFPVEVCLSPYMGKDGGQYVTAFISDISIRKQSEIELIKLNAELEQKVTERTKSLSEALEKEKDLNELKSRFVSMASHEFRTPLSTILSSSYIASKYTTTEEQAKREKHHQRIVASVNTLTDTLNDFLLIGKIEEGKMQTRFSDINVPELINAMIGEMQTILRKGQRLVYKHTGDPVFFLDPSLLKHIMMNLLSNAIKFSPDNSDINIKTQNTNEALTLAVKDSGMGISKEDQQHLFERFFRGSNVTNIEGTGLGLHIVAKYTELMHGNITCESDIDKGTEFIVTLRNQNQQL